MSLITELPRATWLIFRMHLAATAASRRALSGLLFAAVPPLLAFLALTASGSGDSGVNVFMYLGVLVLLQVVAPALGVFLGIGAIADETEARTVTYPFTRPIPRASVFLGRWLASLLVLTTLLLASGAGMAAITLRASDPPSMDAVRGLLSATLIAGVLYSLGAAVIGVIFKRGQVIALGYAFAFEVMLANIPGSAQKLSLQYYLRSLFVGSENADWRSLAVFQKSEFLTTADSAERLLATTVILLVIGCVTVTRKQFVLSS
ncbi:MAG: ABC transporter permease subunit [Planctomycetota bacterium]|nr:ABC transporter permease subunit [Planctomycetota bacterium]MDG1983723.1 ABC transporter permease subunit [Planctomycetota bacterium]